MTACLSKSNFARTECVFCKFLSIFHFSFECGILDLIVLVPINCFVYFTWESDIYLNINP